MERDFMGLKLKESSTALVREEVRTDGYKDSGCGKRSTTGQFPFSNKVSGLPHLMSLSVSDDDKTKRNASDTLTTHVFMPISGTEAFGSRQIHSMGGFQTFSVSNQAIAVPFGGTFFKNHLPAVGQNSAGAAIKLPAGIPVTSPHAGILSSGSIPGNSDFSFKRSLSHSQLTIFYAGTVTVFDDVSPGKAQDIMSLAGNSVKNKVEISNKKLAANSGLSNQPNQTINTSPNSRLSSPISVSSHNGAQSASGSTSSGDFLLAKTAGFPTTTVSKGGPPKTVNRTLFPSAVPQARKASLARFLEKRKERVMTVAPYDTNKKLEKCFNPEPAALNFSTSTNAAIVTQASQRSTFQIDHKT